ncbi:S6 family peptidase [Helicobacter sp. 23-1048]
MRLKIMFFMDNISKVFLFLLLCASLNAQSINISNFYYRDFLDFGQNKGLFKDSEQNPNGVQITGKDGTTLTIPQAPNFSASSNNGNLTAIGRGFVVTANHVSSPENPNSSDNFRKWGLSTYTLAKQDAGEYTILSVSKPYGRDEKFLRFDKYIIEGQASMLDITNSTNTSNPTSTAQESQNLENFKNAIKGLADSNGNVYVYQAGSGVITLRGGTSVDISRLDNGETKGGGFGILNVDSSAYLDLVKGYASGDSRGITFTYSPSGDFNNRITSGDSGSGIYAFDKANNKWILLGVTSQSTTTNTAYIAAVSNKELLDFQKNFEQKIPLSGGTQNINALNLQQNKDIIFSGGGAIQVANNINRNISGYAGGFVFEASNGASSTNPTKYTFSNTNGTNYYFKGSGLDIGQNVEVEWNLRNDKNDALHKIGQGTLIIKTTYTPDTSKGENLGYLKIGEGKVIFDTDKKAYDGVYITSGRGALELKNGKAEAIGASKDSSVAGTASGANSYTLSQNKSSEMGIYFGSGGGVLDLGGNSLKLNTIAANDSGAIITNSTTSTKSTLEIEGFGYDSNGTKQSTKADTIIHASIGESSANQVANIDIIHKGDKNTQNTHPQTPSAVEGAFLIFDGHINSSGTLSAENANIALQGHATTHATISDAKIREQIKNAEAGTHKAMPEYMDLSKPSTVSQPDWDDRFFKFAQGITLINTNLTLGRNASLQSNISADSTSSITFGGGVKHFIDNKDGANINGGGFGYYQKVEGGNLNLEQEKIANQTIHYKGKITANGGNIQSNIWDFNASLDLKNNAKLEAEYLTLKSSDSVRLQSGASAIVQNLKLQNLNENDLNKIFDNNVTNNTKLKVAQKFIFDSVGSLDLATLDSSHIDIAQYYDIEATKSSITGTNKNLIANISLFDSATLSAQNLTLKDTNANVINPSTNPNAIKNLVYLDSSQNNASQSPTKLTLSENLKAQDLQKASVILWGKSEISTPKIEFSNIKEGILLLDSEAKLTNANNQNTNTEIKSNDSVLNIFLSGDKNFDLNASGANSQITLNTIPSDFTPAPSNKPSENMPSVNFSGKISASDFSVVDTTALESITTTVELSGSANLTARNITLDSTHNAINLQGNSMLTAISIHAKNLTQLNLNVAQNATANVDKFIFEKSNITNLNQVSLISQNISLQSSSISANNLAFNSLKNVNLTLDATSMLNIDNLDVNNTTLTLHLADSQANARGLGKINLTHSNIFINSWDLANATKFISDSNSSINFTNLSYAQNNTPKNIESSATISGTFSLHNVGQMTQNANRFEMLNFNKNLTFDAQSNIVIALDSSVSKIDTTLTLGKYYTILSAQEIKDNRIDKRVEFSFAPSVGDDNKLFVVSKFENNALLVKFLESNPRSFSELNKHISSKYSEILKVLIEHNPNDIAIDTAAKTDDYAPLQSRLEQIDSTMHDLANSASLGEQILFSNNFVINTRIAQVRLTQADKIHNLRFANNDEDVLYKQISRSVASDISYDFSQDDDLHNNVWLNVGGGYFSGGDSNSVFASTNVGYDRLSKFGSTDMLFGVMAGFGSNQSKFQSFHNNARFYNVGLYAHGIFGSNEVQSNLNVNILQNNKAIQSSAQQGDNLSFNGLLSVYYKRVFALAPLGEFKQNIKPVALLGVGVNNIGNHIMTTYKQESYNNISAEIGAGVQYTLRKDTNFYSVEILMRHNVYHSNDRVFVSLANAQSFIGYTLEHRKSSLEFNFIGSHALTQSLYIQYGVLGLVDMGLGYGIKGDMKIGYRF